IRFLSCHGLRFTVHVFLHFPEQQVLQKSVVRGETRDGESGESVAEAALEDEAAREGRGACERDAQRRRAPARLEHLARGQGRVALADHSMVVRGVADAVVKYVARQSLDARAFVHADGFVYVRALPASRRAAVEAQLKVRIPAAAANPAPHVEGAPRDAVAVGESGFVPFTKRGDARAELRRDALVGVEAEDPFVPGGTGGELLLGGEAGPVALDDARPARGGDLARSVVEVARCKSASALL